MLQYSSSEKIGKTFKNCSFRTLFRQKWGQHGSHHPQSSSTFLMEITKEVHVRAFYIIKKS